MRSLFMEAERMLEKRLEEITQRVRDRHKQKQNCLDCLSPFIRTGNAQKYCPSCSQKREKKRGKDRWANNKEEIQKSLSKYTRSEAGKERIKAKRPEYMRRFILKLKEEGKYEEWKAHKAEIDKKYQDNKQQAKKQFQDSYGALSSHTVMDSYIR